MVRHLVLWNFIPELTEEERAVTAAQMEEHMLPLTGCIPGLRKMEVCRGLETGDSRARTLALFAWLDDADALARYQQHPAHQAARLVTLDRLTDAAVFDWEESGITGR